MSRPFTFTPGRHPAEICMFAWGGIAGVAGVLFPGARSAVVERGFPAAVVMGWYLLLALWGAFGVLCLLLIRDQDDRRRLEEVALYGYGYIALFYPAAVVIETGGGALTAALPYALATVFATWRILQIRFEGRRWRKVQADARPADPPPLADTHLERGE